MMVRMALLPVLLLWGCAPSPPSGQVVARVDGVDVTRRDVLIELLASGAAADVDVRDVQPALLDRIVVRKLLAAEAHRRSIDRSPEFLGEERRSRETILGDQLVRRVVGRLPPPSPAEIARFVTAHRDRFDDRQVLHVDRIVLAGQPAKSVIQLASNDLIAARLAQDETAFSRMRVEVDSLSLPPARLAVLRAAQGRPVVGRTNEGTTIDQLIDARRDPPSPTRRADLAADLLREQAAQQATDAMIARLRAAARIDYASRR